MYQCPTCKGSFATNSTHECSNGEFITGQELRQFYLTARWLEIVKKEEKDN